MAEAEQKPGALDWLLVPTETEPPCGPDLDATGDAAFLDYYYDAEARLPERYFTPGMDGVEGSADRIFDPRSVNLKAETQEITVLLRRSRDLRLLSLLARFQILAGRPADFADTLQVMAALMAEWPEALHPRVATALSDRRAALEQLASIKTVVMPLQYLPLAGQADMTYRRFLVASGQATARASESGTEKGPIMAALAGPANRKPVEKLHADLGRAAQSLSRIAEISTAHPTQAFRPALNEALQTLTGMQQMLQEAWPNLVMWSDLAPPAPVAEVAGGPDATSEIPPQAPVATTAPADAIADRAGVRRTLEAAERFLARNEPSSPALLLVTQARLLIGRPLIEALETLLPADAGKAVITFAPETGFAMSMDRLKKLSESTLGGQDALAEPETLLALPPLILSNRAELAAQLRAVEHFYVLREPASPIPILLARARGLMDKGFQAIVAELLPKVEVKG